jgi:hypothetical protein
MGGGYRLFVTMHNPSGQVPKAYKNVNRVVPPLPPFAVAVPGDYVPDNYVWRTGGRDNPPVMHSLHSLYPGSTITGVGDYAVGYNSYVYPGGSPESDVNDAREALAQQVALTLAANKRAKLYMGTTLAVAAIGVAAYMFKKPSKK